MSTVLLSQVRSGDKLGEDVLTPFGGLLLRKGEVITPRTIEVLYAFLISSVTLSTDTEEKKKGTETTVKVQTAEEQDFSAVALPATSRAELSEFYGEYDRMVDLLRKTYNSYVAGESFPIMDIRTQLEKLLKVIQHYDILTFKPQKYTEQDYYFHNSVCSALTSYRLAQWADVKQNDWMQIALGGLLKDIGNIKLDRSILTKPAALTKDEFEEMKRHTVQGYQLLKSIAALNEGVKLAALQHHERIDGTGYPLGIDAARIHPYAKIISIADIYHAMTLNKAYRKGVSPYIVLEQLQAEAFGKLDPNNVTLFVEKTTQYQVGLVVKLNDGRIGEIVFAERQHLTRPWILVEGQIVNLAKERHLHIKDMVHT